MDLYRKWQSEQTKTFFKKCRVGKVESVKQISPIWVEIAVVDTNALSAKRKGRPV